MLYTIHKFLFVCLCACFIGTGCYANADTDDYSEYLYASEQLKELDNGDDSVVVINDTKQLKALLENINWAESKDTERRTIYKKLQDMVQKLDDAQEENNQQEIDKKKQELQNAQDAEKSLANRTIGALGIGATGIGGMQLASGLAEQQADQDAEQAMRAYLATFTCQYGDNQVAGGTTDVELPGGNELMALVGQYTQLAADLKLRKQALGIAPGIESERIIDKANSGLYDDEGLDTVDGAYTSVARALTDTNSADAAEWEEQKQKTQEKIKTGATVAAVGAVGSLLANLTLNSAKRGIIAKEAKKINADVRDLLNEALDNCNAAILDAKLKIEDGTDDFSDADKAAIKDMEYLSSFDDLKQLQGHILCN